MAYCTNADVQARLPGLILGAGNNPTTANVDTYIALVQGDIDLELLRAGIDAPVDFTTVTAPVAQEKLRSLNTLGAVVMTVQAAPSYPPDRRRDLENDYKRELQSLSDLVPRLDLPVDVGDTEPRGPGVTQTPVPVGRNRPYFQRWHTPGGGAIPGYWYEGYE